MTAVMGHRRRQEEHLNPTDSFNPQENNGNGVQESSSQYLTTKPLDKSEEAETGQAGGPTKELNEKAEGDFT